MSASVIDHAFISCTLFTQITSLAAHMSGPTSSNYVIVYRSGSALLILITLVTHTGLPYNVKKHAECHARSS